MSNLPPPEGQIRTPGGKYRSALVSILRRLVPNRWKRRLKTLWDPNQPLKPPDSLLAGGNASTLHRWGTRAEGPIPATSIIVVTYNGLSYTRLCLDSIFRKTDPERAEVIVVDNGSEDGTRQFLSALSRRCASLALRLNESNRGFAAAVNQGVALARGETLVILNNDTIVTPGWLDTLLAHLQGEDVGLVVPVTNSSGNESRIAVWYDDLQSLDEFAAGRRTAGGDTLTEIGVAPMYCAALSRSTWDRVGPLDERFGIGLFEDDDYSHRVRLAGLRVTCARDAFVHHFGEASFRRMSEREYRRLFERNQRRFEEKWAASPLPRD